MASVVLGRDEKLLVGYAALAHGLIHVMELTYAAILPFLLLEFGEGLFVMGVVATFFSLAFGLGALPAGVLADRIGSKRLMEICLWGGVLGSVGVALSPSIYLLTVFISLLGLMLGLYHPAGLSLISKAVNPKVVGRGMAVHGIGGSLGTAVAPVMAAGIAVLYDWRVAYLVPAALSLGAVLAIRRIPARALSGGSPAGAGEDKTAPANSGRILLLPLAVVFIVFTTNGFIYRGMITFLPLHLKDNVGFTVGGIDEAAMAGAFTTFALLAAILGQWLGGSLGDRIPREVVLLIQAVSQVAFLALMGLVAGLPLVVVAAMMAMAYFMSQPLTTGLIADYAPRRLQGRMFGIAFFMAFGLGSLAAALSGWVAEVSGTSAVFVYLAGVGTATIVSALALIWMARQRGWRRVVH
ncbi:MAG: MFS transporter [Dehalococcoidia bacterium]|nr:MFS transporter [Dehalococcoidia bacterium]